MDDEELGRFWISLQQIGQQLSELQGKVSEISSRLDERVSNHSDVIVRFGARLDSHSGRLHNIEVWQAGQDVVRAELSSSVQAVSKLQANANITRGRNHVLVEVLKVAGAIFVSVVAAILVLRATGE